MSENESAAGARIINATGELLADAFGRAPLPDIVRRTLAGGYCRSGAPDAGGGEPVDGCSIEERVARRLCALTGAEAALVTGSHAGALHLLARAATGRAIAVAQGQLGTLADGLRLGDILAAAGAPVRMVGAADSLRMSDLEQVAGTETGALLYHQPLAYPWPPHGDAPDLAAFAGFAQEHRLSLLADLPAGALAPLTDYGLPDEPLLPAAVAAAQASGGAVVCAGDLLLNGPACGILLGQRELLARVRESSGFRMAGAGALTLAALEAVLALWQEGTSRGQLPLYRMLGRSRKELLDLAALTAESAREFFGVEARIAESRGCLRRTASGGWRNPAEGIFSTVVCLQPGELPAEELNCRLRAAGVYGNLRAGAVELEMLTLLPGQEEELMDRLRSVLGGDDAPASGVTE